ncbi:MAG: ribokinase [Anaerolineales bacterium]|nr:ribokinase [Anaerolineales bacterium]
MSHIVVVGSINMDMVVRAPVHPAPGETILGSDFHTIPGGKGANQAVAAARLGSRVSMIGRVGKDEFGKTLLENLTNEGINTDHVGIDPEAASGIAIITLNAAGQNTIVVASGSNMRLTPDIVRDAWEELGKIDAVVMQLEIPTDCIIEAAVLANECRARVILNPAPARALPDELYHLIDVIVPNESETSLLTGLPVESSDEVERAARQLLAKGVQAVALTLGGRGASVLDRRGHVIQLLPHQVEVVDTTAAGDAFVAGLAVGLAEGATLLEAAKLGNAAGALAVTRLGAQPAMPTRSEVMKLLSG